MKSSPVISPHQLIDNDTWRRMTRQQRLKANGGSHTEEEWQALLDATGHICLACGKPERWTLDVRGYDGQYVETFQPILPDHVVPVCKGGHDGISNIQPLHYRCNMRKWANTIDYRRGGEVVS